MATPKQAHALVSYFSKRYEEKYGVKPTVNRYAARWGFDSMLFDMGDTEVQSLIDYYFETISQNRHQLDWFFYNYEKLIDSKRIKDSDAAALEKMREQSARRAAEWRAKIDNSK